MRYHADLFDVRFWHQIQARLRAGEVLDIFPYPQNERLQIAPHERHRTIDSLRPGVAGAR
jgi:isocitrate dehydrogenase kinase/phosphatase